MSDGIPARYEVKVELGTGGMGRVYLCRDRDLDVDVAVKVLPPEIAKSPKHLARIESEAKVAARLRGLPGILPLYGFERHGDTCLLVMEYAAGGSVYDRIRDQGRVPEAGCRRVGSEAADALAQAHAAGVLHRDIKPGNILLDLQGRAKVGDFGLGQFVEGIYAGPKDLPLEGTPEYMPPEVMRGQGADGRSDLYSLGVTLYEMATGVPAYRGSYKELKALKTAPGHRPPDPRELQPKLTEEFAAIVMRLMDPDPAARFAGAAACAEALRGGPSPGGPTAPPPAAMAVPMLAPVSPPRAASVGGSRAASSARGAAAPKSSPVPMLAGGAVLLVGIAVAAAFLLRGKPETAPPQKPPTVAPAATGPAADVLVVITKPTGATVIVDDRPVGTTDSEDGIRIPDLLPGVPHAVRATMDDHEPDEQRGVSWQKGQVPAPVVLRLIPKKGLLGVEGGPPRGRVSFRRDGRVLKESTLRDDGTLPEDMIDAGATEIEVTGKGFHPWKGSMRIVAGRNPPVKAEMREKDGKLTVATKPDGAEVSLGGGAGGRPLGKAPLRDVSVPPGKWLLSFEHPLTGSMTKEIVVRGEETTDLGVVELPPPALLDLTGIADDVTVVIAGEPVKGILRRAPGPVAITLQRAGFQSQVAHLDLKSGANAPIKPGPWQPLPGRIDLTPLGEGVAAAVIAGHAYRAPWTILDAYPGVHPVLYLRPGREAVLLRVRVGSGETVKLPVPTFPEPKAARPAAADAAVREAIRRGIDWLVRHQSESGRWHCQGFEAMCRKNKCGGPGSAHYDVGVTGLAALALLEARAVEGAPPSMEPAWRALEWLMSVQDKSGGYGGELRGHDVYNHSIATLAMVEGYRATGDPWLRYSAARGVDLIVQAQNPFLGWRYGIRPKDNDTSVTVWMVRALAAARDAGIQVPQSAFTGARNWLDKVTEREWGRAGYTAAGNGPARPEALMDKFPADKSESLTAAAIHSRLLCGQAPSDDAVLKGVRLVMKCMPTYDEAAGTIDYYYWHYGTLALQGVGGVDWQRWNEAIRKILVKEQRGVADDDRFGSWDAVDPWADDGGKVYGTALNVLTLTAPYRAAPFREIAETTLLSIDSEPAGATVHADGVPLGTTPLRATPIHAGKSVLLLRHAEREDARVEAVLQPFTDNVLAKVTLPGPAGRVDLSDLPRDAVAFLEGRPAKGVASVRAGMRRLTVVRPGHFSQSLVLDAREQPAKPILGTWKAAQEWNRGPLRGLLPAPPEPSLTAVALPADVIEIEGRLGSRSDGVEMVLVAPEPEDGKPFPPFLLDRHEVTVAQYQAYAKAAGRAMPQQPKGSTPRHPVVEVTAADAAAYAKWAGKRLPTAEEWRRAKGTVDRPFPWGECDFVGARNFDGREDGQAGLAPVGFYPGGMSAAGCFDLVGNAAEWLASGGIAGGSSMTPAEHYLTLGHVTPPEVCGFRCAISLDTGKK